MNLCADFTVTCGGKEWTLKPLTVRQRIAYANLMSARAREKAIANAKAVGLKPSETAEMVASAVADAERLSSIVMSCWTIEGAMAVIRLASDEATAEALCELLEPAQLGVNAAKCLNVDVSESVAEKPSGN